MSGFACIKTKHQQDYVNSEDYTNLPKLPSSKNQAGPEVTNHLFYNQDLYLVFQISGVCI